MNIDNTKLVVVSAIPDEIYQFIYHLRKTHKTMAPFLRWNVEEGDTVKCRQEIAEYDLTPFNFEHKYLKAVLFAPVDGKIEKINVMPDGIVFRKNNEFDGALFWMRPILDTFIPPSNRAVYTDFTDYCYESGASSQIIKVLQSFEQDSLIILNR